jgi:hypothetical protein
MLIQNTFFVKVAQAFNMAKLQDVDSLARVIAEPPPPINTMIPLEEIVTEKETEKEETEQQDEVQVALESRNWCWIPCWLRDSLNSIAQAYAKLRFHAELNDFDNNGITDCLEALETINNAPSGYPLCKAAEMKSSIAFVSFIIL